MAKISGGELVVRTLRQAGVEQLFGLHGAHIDTIFQACADHQLALIDTRHEAAAGHAAEGYARAGNRLGVAVVTAGGGFTNVMTSIANAFFDRTPVLYLAGSGALRDAETNTLQAGLDQVAMARPVTKWAVQITQTQNIPRILAQALRIAQSGPRGPVLVDIPWDVLMNTVEETEAPIPTGMRVELHPAPASIAVTKMLTILTQAKRPVMVLGSEATRSAAAAALLAFAERSGMPVFAEYEAAGLLPAAHPLNAGTVQNLFNLNASIGRPDAVLMLGVRFGLYTGHGSGVLIPHEAQVIQVDTDARELGRLQDIALPVLADPRETLLALQAAKGTWPERSEWAATVRHTVAARRAHIESQATQGEPLHPYLAVAEIARSIPHDTVVVADGAEAYTWFTEVIAPQAPGRFLTHSYMGSMGVGFGIALGAQTAVKKQPVMLITGDGSVGFSIAEFDTLVRKQLPLVVVVMNNRSWGATLHFQQAVVGKDRVYNTRLENGAYHDVASAFGAQGYYVTKLAELGPAVRQAFAAGKPACINVRVALDPAPPETRLMMGENPFQ
jgi:acetolactate synthase I/II/III large subunit